MPALLPAPYDELQRELRDFIPAARLISDPLRRLAWGSDASFYRLVPRLVVVAESEDEVRRLLACCARLQTPVTFRAAGTSLSYTVSAIPVPAAVWMLGSGIAGLIATRRRKAA